MSKVATEIVPYLPHLNKIKETTTSNAGDSIPVDGQLVSNICKAWKEYSQEILPHAKVQLQNFMLACMAEGKTHAEEEEEEKGHKRNTSLYCNLTMTEVRDALDFQAKKALQNIAGKDDNPTAKVTTAARVFATAEVAIMLAKETARTHGSRYVSQDQTLTYSATIEYR